MHESTEVWSAIRGPENTDSNNADHTYRRFNEQVIDDFLPEQR